MATTTPHLTTKQLQAGFGVSDMTVWAWRAGTPTRDKLPTVKQGRAVLFKPAAVAAWAKKHELKFDLAAAQKVKPPKPGPKAPSAKAKGVAAVETAKRKTPAGQKQADAVSKAMETAQKGKAQRQTAADKAAGLVPTKKAAKAKKAA